MIYEYFLVIELSVDKAHLSQVKMPCFTLILITWVNIHLIHPSRMSTILPYKVNDHCPKCWKLNHHVLQHNVFLYWHMVKFAHRVKHDLFDIRDKTVRQACYWCKHDSWEGCIAVELWFNFEQLYKKYPHKIMCMHIIGYDVYVDKIQGRHQNCFLYYFTWRDRYSKKLC